MRIGPFLIAGLSLVSALGGCASAPPSVVPMRTLEQPAPCGPAETLIVMLPGVYSKPEEFLREGFVQTVRREQIAADVVLVDAHLGYYQDRTIIDRLHADVIAPARARGVRQVWIVGISLGGVGAMLYADEHPRGIDGLVLLAPYLGSRLSTLEIENAGGLSQWQAPARRVDEEVDDRLWRWLKRLTAEPAAAPRRLPVYQGFGVDDRFAYSNRLFSRSLPAAQVFTIPGGHDWAAWNGLWARIAPALPLQRRAQCQTAAAVLPLKASAPRGEGLAREPVDALGPARIDAGETR